MLQRDSFGRADPSERRQPAASRGLSPEPHLQRKPAASAAHRLRPLRSALWPAPRQAAEGVSQQPVSPAAPQIPQLPHSPVHTHAPRQSLALLESVVNAQSTFWPAHAHDSALTTATLQRTARRQTRRGARLAASPKADGSLRTIAGRGSGAWVGFGQLIGKSLRVLCARQRGATHRHPAAL